MVNAAHKNGLVVIFHPCKLRAEKACLYFLTAPRELTEQGRTFASATADTTILHAYAKVGNFKQKKSKGADN